jgi:hypothetical protein
MRRKKIIQLLKNASKILISSGFVLKWNENKYQQHKEIRMMLN